MASVRHALLLLTAFALTTCRGSPTRTVDTLPPPAPLTCGDGLLQDGEDCDGSAVGTGTCQALGFDSGRLVCNASCHYETTLCVKRCGNGVLDLGEACDGALGVLACTTWGANSCDDTCAVDTRHCVATAFEPGPETDMTKGGPAVVGDLAPKGPGDLVMAVPSFTRVELVPFSLTLGFDPVASRKLSFLRAPVRAELIDANADGNVDVATINADGTFDLLVFQGSNYALQTLDAGCAGGRFLPSNGTARGTIVVTGCGGYSVVGPGGAVRVPTPGATAVGLGTAGVMWADGVPSLHGPDGGVLALPSAVTGLVGADLDGDGDDDLAALTTAGVELFENTGTGFAPRATFTATGASELRVLDLDGDQLPDLFWASGDDLVVRRNRTGFVFQETRVAAGTGVRQSVAIGDVDGDQDLDFAVTVATGPDSTKTRVFFNRAR